MAKPLRTFRRPPRSREAELQKAIIQVLSLRYRALVTITDAGILRRLLARFRNWAAKAGLRIPNDLILKGLPVSPPGWPDLEALLPSGRTLYVECKTATGRQSADQKHMQGEIERRGGTYLLVRSVDEVMDVMNAMNAMENGNG